MNKNLLIAYLVLVLCANVYTQENSNKEFLNANHIEFVDSITKPELLDSLYTYYIKKSPEKSLRFSKKLLAISKQNDDAFYIHKAYNNIASAFYQLQEYDSAYKYVSAGINAYDKSKNDLLLASSYYTISDVLYYKGKHEKGIDYALKALNIYANINDSVKVARLNKEIAVLYREVGDFDKTIEFAIKSLEFFKRNNDSLYMADAYRIMASVYGKVQLNNPEKEKENILIALNLLSDFESNSLYAIVLHDLGSYYNTRKEFDSALIIYTKLEKQYEKNNDSLHIANINLSIGNTTLRRSLDSLEPAMKYFRKAMSIYKALNIEKYISHMQYTFGSAYYAVYEYDSALYYLNKSLELSKKLNYSIIYKENLKYLILLYEATEDFENAYTTLMLYKNYTDSIQGEKVRLKIADLETKYETAEKEKKILELEHKNQIEKSEKQILRLVFSGVFALFILILIGILQKRKKDKLIHRQKELVHKKEKELAKLELEKSKLKEEELRQSVLYKSKQLSTHSLHMMQKNTMLQEIQTDIKNMAKKASDDDKPNYKRINLQIKQSLSLQKDWDVFKLYFEDVNKKFYQKLNEINPDLTTNDHRLCALIKLNMNSKEMASVLNVAPNSIKSSRYRLKKKLVLDAEADLEEFIRGL